MGIVRILLALSVVAVHLPPYKFSPILGAIAVPLFCAISGYLVSYTLTSSSKYSQISMLYLNKVLKLYAIILCRCALLSAYVLVGAIWLANFEGLQSIDHLLLPIVNITFLVKIGSFFSVLTEPYLAPQTNPHDSDFFTRILTRRPLLDFRGRIYFLSNRAICSQTPSLDIQPSCGITDCPRHSRKVGCQPFMTFGCHFFPLELSMFPIGVLSHQ